MQPPIETVLAERPVVMTSWITITVMIISMLPLSIME